MFGGGFYKLLFIFLICAAAVGYFKYTQDQLATLNQEIATKDFALKADEATIAQQQEDLKRQQAILTDTQAAYEAARSTVSQLEDKFHKDNRDLDKFAVAKPKEVQQRVNNATKKVFRCIENTVNEGKEDEGC
jgi:septal ring factor EnvC (AmiA/AmiB activator)